MGNIRRKYKDWRGSNIENAKDIENELFKQLKKKPTKKEFQDAGYHNVWMALYRFRKQLGQYKKKKFPREPIQDAFFISMDIRNMKNQDVERILEECIFKVGTDRAGKVLNYIKDLFNKK